MGLTDYSKTNDGAESRPYPEEVDKPMPQVTTTKLSDGAVRVELGGGFWRVTIAKVRNGWVLYNQDKGAVVPEEWVFNDKADLAEFITNNF